MSKSEVQSIEQKLDRLDSIESEFASIKKELQISDSKSSITAFEKLYELGFSADDLTSSIKYELATENYSSLKLEYPYQKELLKNINNDQDTPAVKFYKTLNTMIDATSEQDSKSSILSIDFFDIHYDDLFDDFHSWFDVFGFYKSRIKVGPIISRSDLPPTLIPYFHELKDSYAFGLKKSVISLCRVIIEISIDNRLVNVNLYKIALDDFKRKHNHDFCLKQKIAFTKKYSILPDELESKAQEIRESANAVLHISSQSDNEIKFDLLRTIENTVEIVEYLYR